jgi:hypothetical protein
VCVCVCVCVCVLCFVFFFFVAEGGEDTGGETTDVCGGDERDLLVFEEGDGEVVGFDGACVCVCMCVCV